MLGALFSVDDITGFEITKAIELPQPYGVVFLWGVLLPSLFILANALTSLVFKDGLIVKVRIRLWKCALHKDPSTKKCAHSGPQDRSFSFCFESQLRSDLFLAQSGRVAPLMPAS